MLLSLSRTIFLPEAWGQAPTALQSRQGGQMWSTTTIMALLGSLTGNCGSVAPRCLLPVWGRRPTKAFWLKGMNYYPSLVWQNGKPAWAAHVLPMSPLGSVSRYWWPSVGEEATGNFRVFTLVNTNSSGRCLLVAYELRANETLLILEYLSIFPDIFTFYWKEKVKSELFH